MSAELVIFARFRTIEGNERELAAELRETAARVRAEPGCLFIETYQGVRDKRLFWLHSRRTRRGGI
jgi:quinol monooxygenase YgiN